MARALIVGSPLRGCQGRWPARGDLARAAGLAVAFAAAAGLPACKAEYPAAAHPEQPIPEEIPLLVVPEDAALFIGHEGVRFVDARPAKQYRRGHVPGALNLEWPALREPGEGPFSGGFGDDPEWLSEVLGMSGISSQDWVIVVGDPASGWGEEGRIAWTLLYLGHAKVSVLDGGHAAWTRRELPLQKGRVTVPAARYEASVRSEFLAKKDEVQDFVDRRDDWRYVVVDVREPEEYRGVGDGPMGWSAARGGHIPSAVNLPWRSLLDAEGRVKPREELGKILIPLGIRPDAEIVVYCSGGVRAGHTWFVLHWLGYPSVRNYAGSWWEWALDRSLPTESGGARERPQGPAFPGVGEP